MSENVLFVGKFYFKETKFGAKNHPCGGFGGKVKILIMLYRKFATVCRN